MYIFELGDVKSMENQSLHKEQMKLYKQYCSGNLTITQYLKLIKPLDLKISQIEMAMFQGIPVS